MTGWERLRKRKVQWARGWKRLGVETSVVSVNGTLRAANVSCRLRANDASNIRFGGIILTVMKSPPLSFDLSHRTTVRICALRSKYFLMRKELSRSWQLTTTYFRVLAYVTGILNIEFHNDYVCNLHFNRHTETWWVSLGPLTKLSKTRNWPTLATFPR